MIRVSELTVYVRDRNMGRAGVLAGHDLATLAFNPERDGVGSWCLSLPDQVRTESGWEPHEMCAALREPGAGLVIRRGGRTIFSGPMVAPDLTRTRGDIRGSWKFSGESDECVLADALAWPVPSNPVPQAGDLAVDARSGTGSAVIVGYVHANIGEGAPAVRRGLLASRLVTWSASVLIGEVVSESVRYENLLAVCQRVARQSGAHFRVVDEGGWLELQIYASADRSDDTRWTVTDGFLDKLEWQSGAPGVTRPLVGGSGVGEYRPMVAPTTPESVAAEAVWGRMREAFIDSRGVDELAELEQRGIEALQHPVAGLVADPSEETVEGWGELWDVGDLLTLPETGVQYPITGVAVAVSDSVLSVQAVLGALADDDAVQRSVESRVSNLERNESGVPVGTVVAFAGLVAPRGWLLCRGSSVARSLYPALAETMGTAFGGSGDTVLLPDMRGRVPVGLGTDAEFNTLGKRYGTKSHTLTSAEIPNLSASSGGAHSHGASSGSAGAHTHGRPTDSLLLAMVNGGAGGRGQFGPSGTGRYYFGSPNLNDLLYPSTVTASGGAHSHSVSVSSGGAHTHDVNSGGGGAHNNVQPSLTMNFIIKA